MAELAPSGGGPNRLFVILALGLGGLLVLGLLAVGGIFLFQRVTAPPPATPVAVRAASTPTRAPLPTAAVQATSTEAPSPTFVLVAQGAGTLTPGGVSAAATVTGTVKTGTPGTGTPGTGLPPTGVGEDLLLLAGGVVLVLIVFAARRARASGSA